MKSSYLPYVLALIVAPAFAQTIYRSTDAQGNPVFTDQPTRNAKPIDLPAINTTPAVAPTGARTTTPQAGFSGYQHVAISVPSSIPNGLAPVTIGIAAQPALQPGHRWRLSLDGTVVAEGEGGSATLDHIERGDHQLSAQIFDQSGALVGESEPTPVFVFWPSKNR